MTASLAISSSFSPLAPGFVLALVSLLPNLISCTEGRSPDVSAGLQDAAVVESDAAVTGAGPVDGFTTEAAAAICDALFRCCDSVSLEDYFAPHRASELLSEFHGLLPPNAELDPSSCSVLLRDMFDVTPFGGWVDAVRAGRAGYSASASATCIADLDTASCGQELAAALFDSTCLGFSPPADGRQRQMFQRTSGDGQACAPIRDGVGAAFYGNCNPESHFCCYIDDANPDLGCTYPFQGDGVPRSGSCTPTADVGEACTSAPPLSLCATGNACGLEDTCEAPSETSLALGEPCIDAVFRFLGECEDGYCDVLGTSLCEPYQVNGASCTAGYECQSGACVDLVCSEPSFCTGVDSGPESPDPVDPAADLDAGPMTASGESCANAIDLASSSSPSSEAGYDQVVSALVATGNDYNPLDSSGLEPGCSVVYDANGFDTVYSVELQPGQTLHLRYALTPSSAAGAIYVLDGCAPVSWPDYDGSGACGNNEYKTNGFCGVLGCDPLVHSFTYSAQLGAGTREFWVVLDEVAGTAGTSFQLDWRID